MEQKFNDTIVLKLDEKLENTNRIYYIDVVEKALKKLGTKPLLVYKSADCDLVPDNAVGEARNPRIDGAKLRFDIVLYDEVLGKLVSQGEAFIRTGGIGSACDGVVNDDYELERMFIVKRSETYS